MLHLNYGTFAVRRVFTVCTVHLVFIVFFTTTTLTIHVISVSWDS
jgi:hypothetical protein